MTPSSSPFEDALYGQAADADSHAAASPLVTSASVTATTTPPLQPSPRKLGTSSMPLIMTRSAGNSAQGSPDHDQHATTTTPHPRARGHQEQQQHLPMASLTASEPPWGQVSASHTSAHTQAPAASPGDVGRKLLCALGGGGAGAAWRAIVTATDQQS